MHTACYTFVLHSSWSFVVVSEPLNGVFNDWFLVFGLPFKIYCDGCQALLYRGDTPKPPYEIIEDNNGKCPNCSRKLSVEPISFEVKPVEEATITA